MKFQGFVGPSYKLKSPNINCQRTINLIPEIDQSGTGKEGQVKYFKSAPGLEKIMEIGDGPIRMILVDEPVASFWNPVNRVFIASGSEMYKASLIDGEWEFEKLGNLETSEGPVSGVAIQGHTGTLGLGSAVFVDGVKNYIYRKYDSGDALIVEEFGTFEDFEFEPVNGATHVTWIDGFFIYTIGTQDKFYVSQWGSLAVNPLDFASAEGSPDSIVAAIALNRYLYLMNERSIEVWSNTGNASFPFERTQGGFIEKGIIGAASLSKIDGKLIWLGRDESGQGIVYMTEGLNPQRISTHAVEYAISTYSDLNKASSFAYQRDGHSYYVLNFPEGTWVFDLSTGEWHERLSLEDGELKRHRANVGAFFPFNGTFLVGDYENNKVYLLKDGHFVNDEYPLARIRIAPHLSSNGKRIFYHMFQLDMMTGVGLDGDVQGSDPQVMLQWSNDDGHTWSSESWVSAGKRIGGIGDFSKRVIWRRLGSSYTRTFKIMVTDPVDVVISGADVEFEVGV